MKKLALFLMTSVISLTIFAIYGQNIPYKANEKIHFLPQKEKLIINAATKIVKRTVPECYNDTLIPVIFSFYLPYYHPVINKKAIEVHFIRHENDYREKIMIQTDPVTKRPAKDVIIEKVPNSVVSLIMFEESLAPIYLKEKGEIKHTFIRRQ